MTRTVAVLLATLGAVAADAAAPEVTHLFPAGGQVGTTVEITAGGKFDSWPLNVWSDDPAVTAEAAKDKGKFRVTIGAEARPGPHRLRFFNDEGASRLCPFIVGKVPELIEAETNDLPNAPHALDENPVVVNGQLKKNNDVDHFSLPLKTGDTLVASLTANRLIASPMDGVLQVVAPDGFVVAENHDHVGLDPQIAFTAPSDGTYVVRVFAFPETPDSSIRFSGAETYVYRLTLTTGGWADHAFPSAVREGDPADEVTVRGWNIPEDGGADESPTANAIEIRTEPHPCLIESDDAGPIAIPVTISGRIDEPGDSDTVRFLARKGESWLIDLDARSEGSPLDGTIRVLDSAGKVLKQADDGSGGGADPELTFAAPADGEYTIEVTDLFGHGDWRHWYRLRVVKPEPSFTLSVSADRFAGEVGKPVEIPVDIARTNGHAANVEIGVEGLKVEPVVADPKAKQVTLKVPSTQGFSGPIRIVGKDDANTVDASVEPVWLTITPEK